jgi:hypothetical protein
VETRAVDEGSHYPENYEYTDYEEEVVKENLKMLGYR